MAGDLSLNIDLPTPLAPLINHTIHPDIGPTSTHRRTGSAPVTRRLVARLHAALGERYGAPGKGPK